MKALQNRIRVSSATPDRIRQILLGCVQRSKLLLHGQMATETASVFQGGADKLEENRKAFADLVARARSGDRAAQAEAQQIQIYAVENFLRVQALWASFFDQGTLGPTDIPFFENTLHNQVSIIDAAQDNPGPRWQNMQAKSKYMVQLYGLSSNEFEYYLMDWYSGQVADRAKANIDISFDLAMQLDARLQNVVKACCASFTLTGDKWNRVYLPHTRIVSSNLPTTNVLTTTGNSGSSVFRIACLDDIITYCRSWGEQTFSDGPLVPVAVFIPSSHCTSFLKQVEVDDPENAVNRQVFDLGVVQHYGGYNWTFIADPTLDPAAGAAYVKFNKSIGMHWSKPSVDNMIIDDSPDLRKNNLESATMTKVFATVAPAQRRMNVAKVVYRTPA
jgi:hypothetical protein